MSANESDEQSPEGFVARWARLKREKSESGSAVPEQPSALATAADGHGAVSAEASGTATAEAETPELPLPSVDDLTPESNITAFLDKRVPEELRRLAMRRMWTLDPAIRDFIEIAENQYDWNDPNGVPGFGPLPEGTDIEALLAQATGAVKPKAEGYETDVASTAGQPDAGATVSEAQSGELVSSEAVPVSDDTPDHGAETEDLVTVAERTGGTGADAGIDVAAVVPDEETGTFAALVESRPPPAASQRRRHGGALPI